MIQRACLLALFFLSDAASAADTLLKLYRPFGEVVEQTKPVIKKKVSGDCFTQSHLIVREDAWRCQAEGTFYDPCFVHPAGKKMEALCPVSPWIGDSVQITVSEPLDNTQHTTLDMSRTFPWAIELMNGEQCQAIDSDRLYDGMPLRYRCNKKNLLIGYLQRCKSEWSMLEKTASGVKTVDLKKAWF